MITRYNLSTGVTGQSIPLTRLDPMPIHTMDQGIKWPTLEYTQGYILA